MEKTKLDNVVRGDTKRLVGQIERGFTVEFRAKPKGGADEYSQAVLQRTTFHHEKEKSQTNLLYKAASLDKRRKLLKTLLSNLTVTGKNVELTLALPFRLIAEREKLSDGRNY